LQAYREQQRIRNGAGAACGHPAGPAPADLRLHSIRILSHRLQAALHTEVHKPPFGGHMECDRGVPREWTEHLGAAERGQRGQAGNPGLLALPQPQQAPAHRSAGARGLQGGSAAQLAPGCLHKVRHSTNNQYLNPRILQKITDMYVYTGIPESLL